MTGRSCTGIILALAFAGCSMQAKESGEDGQSLPSLTKLDPDLESPKPLSALHELPEDRATPTVSRLTGKSLIPPQLPGVAAARAFYDQSALNKPHEQVPLASIERPSFPKDLVVGVAPVKAAKETQAVAREQE